MFGKLLLLWMAAVATVDAFSAFPGPMGSLAPCIQVSLTARKDVSGTGSLGLRMGGDDRPVADRRDALTRACALLAAGLPVAAGAEQEEGTAEVLGLGYNIRSELESWKGWSTKRSFKRAGRNFDIEQRFSDNRQNGMAVYEGNEAMTEYMEQLGKPFFQGKSVLELGTGTGFGSMVALTLGARAVTATDRNPKVLDLADANFMRNFPEAKGRNLNTGQLLWGADQCREGERWKEELGFCWKEVRGANKDGKFDIIIGSDLTYSEGVLPDLIKTLKDFMHADSQVILVWCEPKLFTWNTDVMSRLNEGIAKLDQYFDAETVLSNKTYNSHPDTTIVKLKLNDAKPGYPEQPS